MIRNNNVIAMKTLVYQENQPDLQTGELVPVRTITREVESKERFLKMYVEDIAPYINCTNSEKNLIGCLSNLGYIEYNTNEIILSSHRREQLASCANIQINSLNNSISRMLKKHIFIKDGKRMLLNPTFFFVGEEIERAKQLNLLFKYNMPTVKFKRARL